jgi:hypothetical protein
MRLLAQLAALCLLLSPVAALADPFSDFRIPDHSWRSGTLNASATGDWFDGSGSGLTAGSSSFNSVLRPSLVLARDSDPLQLSLGLALAGDVRVLHNEQRQDAPDFQGRRDIRRQGTDQIWQLEGSLRAYPWATPVGLSLSGVAAGAYRQDWERLHAADVISGAVEDRIEGTLRQDLHAYAYDVAVSAAAGLGRVRDATVIQDVHVLEQRLSEAGAITRPLSKQAREKLAALYYVAPFYVYAHDRPDRYAWRDIEHILREDGALSERGFDAYSVLRAREPYLYRIQRARGWFAGPVAIARHRHSVQRFDGFQTVRYYSDDSLVTSASHWTASHRDDSFDEFELGGTVEHHRPLGWRWQLDLLSRVTAPARPGETGLHAQSAASVSWLVADRWLATAKLSHSRDSFKPRLGASYVEDSWRVIGGIQLGWYVEDHTQLVASVAQSQGRLRVFGFPEFPGFSRDTWFSVGVGYRFLGALDAPGLAEPQRPARP